MASLSKFRGSSNKYLSDNFFLIKVGLDTCPLIFCRCDIKSLFVRFFKLVVERNKKEIKIKKLKKFFLFKSEKKKLGFYIKILFSNALQVNYAT